MATLPVYEARVDDQVVPQVQMSPELFKQGDMIKEQAKAMEEINQKFKTLRDTQEEADATIGLTKTLDDIETRALNDNDPNAEQKYQQEINEAVAKHSTSITDQTLRMKANEQFTLAGFNSFSKVQAVQRKKAIERKDLSTQEQLARSKDAYASADQVTKALLKKQAEDVIKQNVDTGVWTAERAKTEIAALQKWDVNAAMLQAETDPAGVLANIRDGLYPELQGEERKTVSDYAYQNMNRDILLAEKARKEFEQKEQSEALIAAGKGEYTLALWQDQMARGAFGDDVNKAEQFKQMAMSGINVAAVTDPITFSNLSQEFMKLGTIKGGKLRTTAQNVDANDLAEFRAKVIMANKQGKLDLKQTNEWTEAISNQMVKKSREEFEKTQTWYAKFGNWIDQSNDTFADKADAYRHRLESEWLTRVGVKNENPAEVLPAMIQQNEERKRPSLVGKKDGDPYTSASGKHGILRKQADGSFMVEY